MPTLGQSTQICFVATLAMLALHLWAERKEWRGLWVATKLLASTGFLLTALSAGALDLAWGRLIVVGLAASWVGDACLLSRARGPFLAGLGAFLLGHVAYCAAFWHHGVDLQASAVAAPVMVVAGVIVERRLRPGVDASMRGPVLAYIVVISLMVSLAVGAWWAGASPVLLVGALAFYLSDLSVARDRFVVSSFENRLWGLPAYYLGQLCLAVSVGLSA